MIQYNYYLKTKKQGVVKMTKQFKPIKNHDRLTSIIMQARVQGWWSMEVRCRLGLLGIWKGLSYLWRV